MKRIAFIAPRQAALLDEPDPRPGGGQVLVETLASLVSPGTELNWAYASEQERTFPQYPGYASVGRIVEIRSELSGKCKVGEIVFYTSAHASLAALNFESVVPIGEHLDPKVAVFARLMGVSMASLATTNVPPPAGVLVTGLGPVGHLAAQIFSRCGYRVSGYDPVAERRALAEGTGIRVITDLGELGPCDLALECSGHEQAVLDAANHLRHGGEIRLIGVPWQRKTEAFAHTLLHAVFHRYVTIRSGWEWEIPTAHADFVRGSHHEHYRTALDWLREGSIRVNDLYTTASPADCDRVYAELLDRRFPAPSAIFDWMALKA